MKVFRAFVVCALLSLPGVCFAMDVKNEYFTLSLSNKWTQRKTDDPEQWVFESDKGQITISVVGMQATKGDLERIANKLLEIRYEAEQKLRQHPAMTEPWGTEHPDGTLQVNYMGHDGQKTFFFFSGYVGTQGTLSVTGELINSSDDEIKGLFQEVLSNLTF